MDYQKIIDSLLEKEWSMQLTCEKQGFEAVFFNESIKQSYIPLPQIKGNTLDEVMSKIIRFFKLDIQ
jgi:hypothetical protein